MFIAYSKEQPNKRMQSDKLLAKIMTLRQRIALGAIEPFAKYHELCIVPL